MAGRAKHTVFIGDDLILRSTNDLERLPTIGTVIKSTLSRETVVFKTAADLERAFLLHAKAAQSGRYSHEMIADVVAYYLLPSAA